MLVPAGTPVKWSAARRCDCMINSSKKISGFATVELFDTLRRDVRFTARIPIQIGGEQAVPTYGISGTVTDTLGAPLQRVTVTVSSCTLGGSPSQSVLTDAVGNYTVPGLVGTTYDVTPSLPSGVNFMGPVQTQVGFSISGKVTNQRTGQAIPGVTMSLSGAATATTATDAAGFYSFIAADGRYTVTPSMASLGFPPSNKGVNMNGANVSGADFKGK